MDVAKVDKKVLFAYLDELREKDRKKYAEICEQHSDDLYDVGYFKHESC